MNRKRGLISDIFKLKKRRTEADKFGVKSDEGAPTDIRGSLEYLMTLFPRKLFNDALPQIVLKHQLYSIHRDKTLVDKEVNKMREDGELLMFQLGFDAEAFALVFTSDYKAKVSAAEEGRDTRATVGRFLEKLSSPCTDLSFDKDRMITEFLFADAEITQLVKAGVLTVRDAGSWWLSIPNSGRFTKYFIQAFRQLRGLCCDLLAPESPKTRNKPMFRFGNTNEGLAKSCGFMRNQWCNPTGPRSSFGIERLPISLAMARPWG
ncbi:inactive serine/threonine-protein kinase 19-like isoform X1 [Syngnathoides biaculeatus]|uniref:inactive serine/threonine-protein kinase 19-like isoform X1 n=1 Tax=Syngnathoides biaculeatus TaxID=300417 RepID=UPI002ADD7102|nr:inactive serine/threonine-protein kinase 19-like isoform X1 [Syngnathoides biaculeatus]XP_061702595.1 inactive serine/threonine-protein kinase 19-like isoform X1 [Syngnathoides biaculeatus]